MTSIVFFPDYRPTNPYQRLLYSEATSSLDIVSGTIEDACKKVSSGQHTIFHLHWPEPIFAGTHSPDQFDHRATVFLSWIKRFKGLGGKFLLTMHNAAPHSAKDLSAWMEFLPKLCSYADRIHIHTVEAVEAIQRLYSLDKEKCFVVPHGNYIDSYRNSLTTEDCRIMLGVKPFSTVFGFVGQVRPYKGLDMLVAAFNHLSELHPDVDLVLAGKPVHPLPNGFLKNSLGKREDIHVFEGYIPDDDIQKYLNSLDVIVLPYSNILTSGSVMLAASFGLPVILPRLETLRDVIGHGFTIDYDPVSPTGLLEAMQKFMQLTDAEREAMRKASYAFAEDRSWQRLSTAFFTEVSQMAADSRHYETLDGNHITYHLPTKLIKSGAVGVSLVGYNSGQQSKKLLNSLPHAVDGRQVVVFYLDNGQNGVEAGELYFDNSERMVRIEVANNLGYADGNNVALELMREFDIEYFWILNPDTVVNDGALDELLRYSTRDPSSIISPFIVSENGNISFAGGRIGDANHKKVVHLHVGDSLGQAPTEPYSVDFLNGCCVFGKLKTLNVAGKIPSEYFLYYEETDWFMTMREKNISLVIIPSASVVHSKASHGSEVPTLYYVYYFLRSGYFFNSRYGGDISSFEKDMLDTFVAGWSSRIARTKPSFSKIFDRAVSAAINDGRALLKGPVVVGARMDDMSVNEVVEGVGYVELVNTEKIQGWYCRRPDANSAWCGDSKLWLVIDDIPFAELVANLSRMDVGGAGYVEHCGFDFPTPEHIVDGGIHKIEIRCSETGRRLPFVAGDYRAMLSFNPPLLPLSSLPTTIATLDGLRDGALHGWAFDRLLPNRSALVDIGIDGERICNVRADILRHDLANGDHGDGLHGVFIPLPVATLRRGELDIAIYQSGTDHVLSRKRATAAINSGYMTDFTPSQFLAWAWINDQTPVGSFELSEHLVRYFERSRSVLHLTAVQQPNDTLATVIMPVFNRQHLVRHAIESVQKQTYQNWELIIVDDGSSDGSFHEISMLVDSIKDERLKLTGYKTNKGVSFARNYGLRQAKGEYVLYLDSDNEWYPECISILVHALNSEPNFDAVYAAQEIWEKMPQTGEMELRSVRASPFNRSRLEYRNYIDLNVFAHRRVLFDTLGGFREDMRRLVDWELILRYTNEKSPLFVPAILNRYAVNLAQNQITKTESYDDNLKKIRECLE